MSEGVGKAVSRRFSFALRSLAASQSVFICEVRRQGLAVTQRETAGSCMARWGGGEIADGAIKQRGLETIAIQRFSSQRLALHSTQCSAPQRTPSGLSMVWEALRPQDQFPSGKAPEDPQPHSHALPKEAPKVVLKACVGWHSAGVC